MGDYRELALTNRQYAFGRGELIVAVNNDDGDAEVNVPAADGEYTGLLYGGTLQASGGRLNIPLPPNNGEIYAPSKDRDQEPVAHLPIPESKKEETKEEEPKKDKQSEESRPEEEAENGSKKESASENVTIPNTPYEEMSVEQLQSAILQKMAKNGPVTDQMRRDVENNIWHDSLVNWVKSFR